jgi:hypothetical protein
MFTRAGDAVLPGLQSLAAAGSPGWGIRHVGAARRGATGLVADRCRAAGPLLMLAARFVSRPAFCQVAGAGRNWTQHWD